MIKNILIIGGTQEGNILAEKFRHYNFNYIISYSGIVDNVHEKRLNKRVGGFGGKIGIINFIEKNKITHVIDASHPFSNKISYNTTNACNTLNIPLISYTRKPWYKKKKDNWTIVKDFNESTNYLKGNKKRIFLAIGRKNLEFYKRFSHHFFLLRVLEKKNDANFFPNQKCIISKGPFMINEDKKIIKKHKIDIIITKNSGGTGAYSKIVAARELGIPVIIISRPRGPRIKKVYNLEMILNWINYETKYLGV